MVSEFDLIESHMFELLLPNLDIGEDYGLYISPCTLSFEENQ